MPAAMPNSPSQVSINGCETLVTETMSGLFQDPDADIIIRTSDEVDFRVYKVILGIASPVFKTIFTLPQPVKSEGKVDNPDSIPVVPISESSSAIDLLLQFCYPVEPPQLDESGVSLIGEVLAAAMKYEIKAATGIAKKALRACAENSHEDAIAAYSIACHLKQEDDARATAITCLKWPFPGPMIPQLGLISGLDHNALAHFHKDACAKISNAFGGKLYDFVTKTCAGIIPEDHVCLGRKAILCENGNSVEMVYVPKWWDLSMDEFNDVFRVAPFDIAKLSLATLAPRLLETTCRTCTGKVLRGWEETREKFNAYMREKLDEVELALSWT